MTQTKNTLNELILKINENNIFIKSPDESDISYGELISYMKDTYSKLSSIKINKEDKVAIVLGQRFVYGLYFYSYCSKLHFLSIKSFLYKRRI